jgi:hypothetical protein
MGTINTTDTMYADISRWRNLLYSEYGGEQELYSIDKNFVYLSDWQNDNYAKVIIPGMQRCKCDRMSAQVHAQCPHTVILSGRGTPKEAMQWES